MEQTPIFYKNPIIATVLSFFVPGLGHLYNGQLGRAGCFLVLHVLAWLIAIQFIGWGAIKSGWFFLGCVVIPAMWAWSMVDANRSARRVNANLAAARNQVG